MRATRALLDVARSPLAAGVGLAAGVAVFLLQVWLPNLGLIWSVVTSGTMPVGERAGFLWDSLGAIHTNFTPLGAWLAGAVSLLFGLNTAVTVRYLRRRLALGATGGLGLAGLIVALVGVGCSACGAIVLSFLVGTTATASFVGTLPLGGNELDFLAVAVLAATFVISLRKLAAPMVCEPPMAGHTTQMEPTRA